MRVSEADPEGYLEAFMNGFEFVLLAMRGRLQAGGELSDAERAHLEALVEEYARIPRAYRARKDVEPSSPLAAPLPFKVELAEVPAN